MIDDHEVDKLLTNLAKIRGPNGFSEDEANILINWAKEIIYNYTLYTLVIDGLVNVDVQDGEIMVNITELGMIEVEKNLTDAPQQTDLLQ